MRYQGGFLGYIGHFPVFYLALKWGGSGGVIGGKMGGYVDEKGDL